MDIKAYLKNILIGGSNSEQKKEMPQTNPNISSSGYQNPLLYGAMGAGGYGGGFPIIVERAFTGEKEPGNLGAVIRDIPIYEMLRLRAYSAYATTDIIKILASKRFQWVIGAGLQIEIEPDVDYLAMKNIQIPADFKDTVEATWKVSINSKYSDYQRKKSLHGVAKDIYQDKFLGGDCLCVCRIENDIVNVQFISGEHVKSPMIDKVIELKPEANYIEHGIEFNERGEEVAYYVQTRNPNNLLGGFERIPAYGEKTKRKTAWMIYGQKLSPDHKRGIPEIAQVLEKSVKLDRYSEASVTKAEQAANINYTIEHDIDGSGESFLDSVQKAKIARLGGVESTTPMVDNMTLADGHANRIQQTTQGQVINMVPGSTLKAFTGDIGTNYGDFHKPNFEMICASVDTPPEVALQSYNSNYSASRAAINGWGYIVDLDRENFADQFYKPYYKLWLEVEVLKGEIEAPGFITALNSNNWRVVDAYSCCRFVGKNMPHIDPLKEANAIRVLLGDATKGEAPLISHEQAVEMLGFGDWWNNYDKSVSEQKEINKNSINNAATSTVKESGSNLEQQA